MKNIYYREIRHIVANYQIKNNPTGYRSNSISISTGAVRKMLKWKWVESSYTIDDFMFVLPTKAFLENTWKKELKQRLN